MTSVSIQIVNYYSRSSGCKFGYPAHLTFHDFIMSLFDSDDTLIMTVVINSKVLQILNFKLNQVVTVIFRQLVGIK